MNRSPMPQRCHDWHPVSDRSVCLVRVGGPAGTDDGCRRRCGSRRVDCLDDLSCPPHPGGGSLGVVPVGGAYLTGASSDAAVSADSMPDRCRYYCFAQVAVDRKITGEQRLGARGDQMIWCHGESPSRSLRIRKRFLPDSGLTERRFFVLTELIVAGDPAGSAAGSAAPYGQRRAFARKSGMIGRKIAELTAVGRAADWPSRGTGRRRALCLDQGG